VGAKLTAVAAGPGKFLLYDLSAGSFVAGVTRGELRTDPARFGLLNRPQLLGDVTFNVAAEGAWRYGKRDATVSAAQRDYQGLHLQSERVLLVCRIAEIEVLESPFPSNIGATLTREVQLAPHEATMWLAVVDGGRDIMLDADRRSAEWTDKDGVRRSVTVDAASTDDGKRLFLRIDGLRPVDQVQVSLNLRTSSGTALKCDVYGTINALASPYHSPPESPLRRLLARENLVAWCIVPFDSRRRGPEERAAMLNKLGIRSVAYDWRAEHIPTFDAELDAYARHEITLHAFWMPVDTESPLTESHWPIVLDLVRRHHVSTQFWVMLNNSLVEDLAEQDRAQRAAEILAPVARAAARLNCRIGFYNHGGWWGEPESQIRVLEILNSMGLKNIGLVYNFHHGHAHVANFAQLARRMQPYLITANINGMRDGGPQILPVGRGTHERAMLLELAAAGYRGPIGILHHRDGYDAELGLRENLLGMEHLLEGRADVTKPR
jgi:hypothetical protein